MMEYSLKNLHVVLPPGADDLPEDVKQKLRQELAARIDELAYKATWDDQRHAEPPEKPSPIGVGIVKLSPV